MKSEHFRRAWLNAIGLLALYFLGATVADCSGMPPGKTALAPIQFTIYCSKKPERCAASDELRRIDFDENHRQHIERINRETNNSIAPVEHPPEVPWADDATTGDCNEYVLKKRALLLDLAFPPSALLLAVAQIPSGEAHLVLVVVTDQGDFILDNLQNDVLRWDVLPYRWIKRSTPHNPRLWQYIFPTNNLSLLDRTSNNLPIGAIRGGRGLDLN